MIEVGKRFGGRFDIKRVLGRGGMGVVYEAQDVNVGRVVALKTINGEQSAESMRRFHSEAVIAAQVGTRDLPAIFDTGVHDGIAWIAMELLHGETLASRVQAAGGRLPQSEALAVLQALGKSLSRAHRKGIVHCDIKPENIFLAKDEESERDWILKLLDFGISKMVPHGATSATNTADIGTPDYIAPERLDVRRGRISPATDVWSFGVLAFWLLTGKRYWHECDKIQIVGALLGPDALPLATMRAMELEASGELPPNFDDWYSRCLARMPSGRYSSAGEASEALVAVFANSSRENQRQGESTQPIDSQHSTVGEASAVVHGRLDLGVRQGAETTLAYSSVEQQAASIPSPTRRPRSRGRRASHEPSLVEGSTGEREIAVAVQEKPPSQTSDGPEARVESSPPIVRTEQADMMNSDASTRSHDLVSGEFGQHRPSPWLPQRGTIMIILCFLVAFLVLSLLASNQGRSAIL